MVDANQPITTFASNSLFTLWCIESPPGLLIPYQQNIVVVSTTTAMQVRTTGQCSGQTRKWAAISLINQILADG